MNKRSALSDKYTLTFSFSELFALNAAIEERLIKLQAKLDRAVDREAPRYAANIHADKELRTLRGVQLDVEAKLDRHFEHVREMLLLGRKNVPP